MTTPQPDTPRAELDRAVSSCDACDVTLIWGSLCHDHAQPSDAPRADQWADRPALSDDPGWKMLRESAIAAPTATVVEAVCDYAEKRVRDERRDLLAALVEAERLRDYWKASYWEQAARAEQAERQVREIREWARRFRVGDVIDPEDLHDLSAALSGVSGPTEEAEEGLRAFIVDAVRSNRSLPMALLAEYQITRRRPTTEGASE